VASFVAAAASAVCSSRAVSVAASAVVSSASSRRSCAVWAWAASAREVAAARSVSDVGLGLHQGGPLGGIGFGVLVAGSGQRPLTTAGQGRPAPARRSVLATTRVGRFVRQPFAGSVGADPGPVRARLGRSRACPPRSAHGESVGQCPNAAAGVLGGHGERSTSVPIATCRVPGTVLLYLHRGCGPSPPPVPPTGK